MKSVLISIQPKWCELITIGKKTVEVRKTRPKIDTPFKCYIYETKGKTDLPTFIDEEGHEIYQGRGQVIGEFVCNNIETIDLIYSENLKQSNSKINEILKNSCLSAYELLVYLSRDKTDKNGYAWYISDLVIYDKPKELSEFSNGSSKFEFSDTKDGFPLKLSGMTRPPQSWCYAEETRSESK